MELADPLMARWRDLQARRRTVTQAMTRALQTLAEGVASDGPSYGVLSHRTTAKTSPVGIGAQTARRLKKYGYVTITDKRVHLITYDAHGHRRIRTESPTEFEILTYLHDRGGWVPMRDLLDDLTLRDEDLDGLSRRAFVRIGLLGYDEDLRLVPHVRITIPGEWELAGYNEGVTA